MAPTPPPGCSARGRDHIRGNSDDLGSALGIANHDHGRPTLRIGLLLHQPVLKARPGRAGHPHCRNR